MKNLIYSLLLIFMASGCVKKQTSQPLNATEPLVSESSASIYTATPGQRWEIFERARAEMLNSNTATFSPEWTNLGPNTLDSLSGRVLTLELDPSDPNIVYVGSGSGGLWKSVDAGVTWVSLTDALPSMRVSAIAVNPNNPQEILIGTGVGQVPSTALQPGVGVLKSTDGGQTWNTTSYTYALAQNQSTYKILWDPVLSDTLFLAATNGLFMSIDDGDNWTQILSTRIYDLEIDPVSPNIMYAGVMQTGIQRSTDYGQTWQTLTNGIPSGSSVFRSSIAICDGTPDVLYANLVDGTNFGSLGVYKSIDGGDSWTGLTSAPAIHCQPSNRTNCSGWIFNVVGVSPTDPDLVCIGGVQFWVSADGGANWTWKDYASNGSGPFNKGLTYVDHWDITFHPTHGDTIYSCNDGGVQKSTDGGQFWERMADGLVVGQTYSVASSQTDSTILIAGFHDHGLQRLLYRNGNLTWNRWSFNDGVKTIVHPTDGSIFYGNVQNGSFHKNTNGGLNYFATVTLNQGIVNTGPWITPLVMHTSQPDILFTVDNNSIYRTVNGGGNWNNVASITNARTLATSPVNSNWVYAHAYNSAVATLWRSNNAGNNWMNITHSTTPGPGVSSLSASYHHADVLYATRNSPIGAINRIFKSEDAGDTWQNITHNFPDIPAHDILESPLDENHLYVASDLGVYVSVDGGATWCEFNNNLPLIYTMDLDVCMADKTLRIATFGRGVWKTKLLKGSVTNLDDLEKFAREINLQVFPNPFESTFQVTFDLSKNSPVKIEILDIKGQVLHTVEKKKPGSGFQAYDIDLKENLPSGFYFVRLTLEGRSLHRKITIK